MVENTDFPCVHTEYQNQRGKRRTNKNATPQPEHTVLSLAGTTYDDASELEMELRLEALWLPSAERLAIAGTTSCERWMLGETLFLLAPLSGATKHLITSHIERSIVLALLARNQRLSFQNVTTKPTLLHKLYSKRQQKLSPLNPLC